MTRGRGRSKNVKGRRGAPCNARRLTPTTSNSARFPFVRSTSTTDPREFGKRRQRSSSLFISMPNQRLSRSGPLISLALASAFRAVLGAPTAWGHDEAPETPPGSSGQFHHLDVQVWRRARTHATPPFVSSLQCSGGSSDCRASSSCWVSCRLRDFEISHVHLADCGRNSVSTGGVFAGERRHAVSGGFVATLIRLTRIFRRARVDPRVDGFGSRQSARLVPEVSLATLQNRLANLSLP